MEGGLLMPYVFSASRRYILDVVVDDLADMNLTMNELVDFLCYVAEEKGTIEFFPEEGKYHFVGDQFPQLLRDRVLGQFQSIILWMEEHNVQPNGDMNYILFAYGRRYIEPSYNNYKHYIGAIHKAMNKLSINNPWVDEYRESAREIGRRILGPYEDKKIKENGDVY